MQEFYNDISKKRAGKMRLKTDCEFQQTKIKQLSKEYNFDMYNTNLRGGKAFAAEQKIRELKKLLLRGKRIQKSSKKGVKPNDLIKKATFNLNNIRSPKCGFSPEQIGKKSLDPEKGKQFKDIYNFSRLWRVKKAQDRSVRYAKNLDARKKKRRLCNSLDIGEKVLVLAEKLKKNDATGRLYKSTTENRTFLTETEFLL